MIECGGRVSLSVLIEEGEQPKYFTQSFANFFLSRASQLLGGHRLSVSGSLIVVITAKTMLKHSFDR